MGLFDKIKGAAKAVTGGQADVSIEYPTAPIARGETFDVKVTVRSTGAEVKSEGVFVDLRARESGHVHGNTSCPSCHHHVSTSVSVHKETFDQKITVGPAFVLGANETQVFEGKVTIPTNYQGTYTGTVNHIWEVRGRLEAFGNDPDSGYKTIVVK